MNCYFTELLLYWAVALLNCYFTGLFAFLNLRNSEVSQLNFLWPSKLDADAWLDIIDRMTQGWPKSTIIGRFQVDDLQPRTYHLYRKFTRARHLWLSLRPNWNLLRTHMVTDQPGNYTYPQLLDRLFNSPGRNDLINDTPWAFD